MGLFDMAAGALFGGGPNVNIPNIPRPQDPKFMGIAGPEGQLQEQFSLRQQPRGAFEQRLQQQALAAGPTIAAQRQAERAAGLAQSGFQQGVSNLAQAGGVSAGSRERLARQAALQGQLGRQQAFRAGEEEKLGLQKGFAGTEAQERAGDVASQIQNRQLQNQFELDRYKARLAEYAGAQQGRQQMALAKSQRGQQLFGSMLGAGATLGAGALSNPQLTQKWFG
jgi:hypothetical protein